MTMKIKSESNRSVDQQWIWMLVNNALKEKGSNFRKQNLVAEESRAIEGCLLNPDSVVSFSSLQSVSSLLIEIPWYILRVVPRKTLVPSGNPHLLILAGSDSRREETPETREGIDNKEATFQGVEFMLTGFPNQKEKEIESLIRKCGGYVLSKVPSFSLDKRMNMDECWKPPIVLSPKKVCCIFTFQFFGAIYLLLCVFYSYKM